MKKSMFIWGALVAACIISCVSATVTEPSACDTHAFSWTIPNLPAVPSGVSGTATIPPVSTSTTVNFSDVLSKVSNVASNVQVGINTLTIDNTNGDLSWVTSLEVDMTGSDPTMPQQQLALYTSSGSEAAQLTPTITASQSDVLRYFQAGQVTLTITLGPGSGTVVDAATVTTLAGMSGTIGTNLNTCMSLSGHFNKSL